MRNLAVLIVVLAVMTVAVLCAGGRVKHPVRRLAVTVVMAVLVFMAAIVVLQDRIIFPRMRQPVGTWRPAGIEECTFATEDGLTLHAWWHPGAGPTPPEERPVLLWCHGNAGNITHRETNLRMVAGRGLAALLFDYRGYGKSEGKPSEEGLYRDVAAAYRYLTGERGIASGRIVAFGRSLGAAVALDVALREPVAALIMESAFESVPAMAKVEMPWLPARLVVRSRFDSLGRVGGLRVPLLMLHGDRDEIVPFRQGRAVFDAAPEPKTWYTIQGAGHNDTFSVGEADYFQTFSAFCYEHAGVGKPAAAP